MNKFFKYLLIIFPIILSIILVINILTYYISFSKSKNVIKECTLYEEKINNNNKKNNEQLIQLNETKTILEDKIWEYDRWKKWNQEIKEKIN